MDLSIGDKQAAHCVRNVSSLSTESSEFEFDACCFPELHNEPPLSPKLLYSPNSSPHYYSPNVETASWSSIHHFPALRDIHASKADCVQQQGFDDELASTARSDHESASHGEEKKPVNLRSLLNRRDLQQLPPLTNRHVKSNFYFAKNDLKKESSPASTSSTSSLSPSSSPMDVQEHASHLEKKGFRKKSRRWAFKFDFLRKASSPRAHTALNQRSEEYAPNGRKTSTLPDHGSTAAAADAARLGKYLHERDINAAAAAAGGYVTGEQVNHSKCHYGASAATGEDTFDHQSNQSIRNYQVGTEPVISKVESPKESAGRVICSVGSPASRVNKEMIRANDKRVSRSAPISPAGSPLRSLHGGEGALTHGRFPMSPHALHYEQQRVRNDEQRRRTFLPYRQPFIGACFFRPPTSDRNHPQQALY